MIVRKILTKAIGDGPTIAASVVEKPIGDGLLITTVAATATRIFFGLRAVCVGQQSALLTSMSSVYLMNLPA